MAIYHFNAKVIKRSEGRSAIAAAAYRACEQLHDLRQDRIFDYSQKQDHLFSAVLLPEGASEEYLDRAFLWNEVEANEKRKDAQLARDFTISLPVELTVKQNQVLAIEFVKDVFVNHGMIADVSIHAGHGNEQPHMHVMTTLREVNENGFGKKVRAWNERALLKSWRVQWQEYCNRHLAEHGFDIRIDHRSFETQGIRLTPQNKIGVTASRDREGTRSEQTDSLERLAQHQAIAFANGQAIKADPIIALEALTAQQSTFSDDDIARLANRQSLDAEHFAEVYQSIMSCRKLVGLGKNKQGQMRYTSQAQLTLESELMATAETMAMQSRHGVSAAYRAYAANQATLSPSQANVLEAITQGSDIVAVVGFAGTGKTHLLGAARQVWEHEGYRVRGLALAGKAAEGLILDAGIDSKTISSMLLGLEHGHDPITQDDILVLDEAGMVDSALLKSVIDLAAKAKAKVVLVGDHTQLQPIGAGAAFRGILQRIGFSALTDVRRQKTAWMQAASKNLAMGQSQQALAAYYDKGFVHRHKTQNDAIEETAKSWWAKRQTGRSTMATFMRKDVDLLNAEARQFMREAGHLGKDVEISIHDGETQVKRPFAVGDEIYFTKGDSTLNVQGADENNNGIKNGSRGTITSLSTRKISVRLDGESTRTIDFALADYGHIIHAYAATIHKLQGATFEHTDYLMGFNSNRYLEHVAMTRHKETLDLHWSQAQFRHYDNLVNRFGQEAIKDLTLDYSEHRNIEPLFDIDGKLASDVNASSVDAWLSGFDFAAIQQSGVAALAPLLQAKAHFDKASQQFGLNTPEYQQAQSHLMNEALLLRQQHEKKNVLQGLDEDLRNALISNAVLDNILQPSTQPELNTAMPNENFHVFLASFDWHALEASKGQHVIIADFVEAKLRYEKAIVEARFDELQENAVRDYRYQKVKQEQLQAPAVLEQKETLLEILDVLAHHPDITTPVTDIAPSLAEPLDEFKAMMSEKNLEQVKMSIQRADDYQHAKTIVTVQKPDTFTYSSGAPTPEINFQDWVENVDWAALDKLTQENAQLRRIVEAKNRYERAKKVENERLMTASRQSTLKLCEQIAASTVLQNKLDMLAPQFVNDAKAIAPLYAIEVERSHRHNAEFDGHEL
jgi:Ti-type conjugative transfer relaxase TraA